MRITHVTASVTASGGGIPVVLQCLAAAQSEAGLRPRVIGHEDGGTALAGWPADCPTPLPTRRIPGLPWATGMATAIRDGSPEILHTHGLWSQASVTVPGGARGAGIPHVVSPHGMLDPWALANARWKKRIAARVFEDRHLRRAACLIALCQSEADSIRAYGLKNPIAIIPNGVDLPEEALEPSKSLKVESLKVEESASQKVDGRNLEGRTSESGCGILPQAFKNSNADGQSSEGPRILLFLGRLHPKKGLVNALRAWHSNLQSTLHDPRSPEWQFVIAGWDQGGHEAELKNLCNELGLSWSDAPASEWMTESSSLITAHCSLGTLPSVAFTGPAFGKEKDQLLRRASAFILPSFSEGLPMSVLEAWAYRLPVLMTDHCNLPEGFAHHAALRIGTDVASIAEGLQTLFQLPSQPPTKHQEQRTKHICLSSDLPPSDTSAFRPSTFRPSDLRPPSSDLRPSDLPISDSSASRPSTFRPSDLRPPSSDLPASDIRPSDAEKACGKMPQPLSNLRPSTFRPSDLRLLDLRTIGQNGRALVERQFTWPQVARQLKEVYAWVLGQGPKPDCVREEE
jgi:glycosyltransferase involved in cell wall biosynthesis